MNKKIFILSVRFVFLVGIFCIAINSQQVRAQVTPKQVVSMIPRGINIGNTLDAPGGETNWGNPEITEANFTACKNAGFQCVRVPVTWDRHASPSAPYTIDQVWMARVEQVVDWGLSKGLFIILNAHHEKFLKENFTPENIVRFEKIWTQIANRFQNKSDRLIFEMINEPEPLTTLQSDTINRKILPIIRATNPTRIVLYSGGGWSNSDQLMAAKIPNDNYIIGYYHSYDPSQFGLDGKGTFGALEMATVKAKFDVVKQWSNANNVQVILGEFGATEMKESFRTEEFRMAERKKYYAYAVEQAIANNIPFCAWDMKLINRYTNVWSELKDVIINTSGSANWRTTVQAENYTNSFGVNTQPTTDANGGLNVGWIDDNDYMAYANNVINIPADGQYTVEYRVASTSKTGVIEFRETGATPSIYGTISVPNTGGFQNWVTIKHNVQLTKGAQTFRIQCLKGGFNLNWFRITQIHNPTAPSLVKRNPIVEETPITDIKSIVRNNVLTVKLTGDFSNVRLYSIEGKQLVSFSTEAVEKDIDMSSYKAGVYVLKVSTSGSNVTTKVIKN